MKQEVASFLDYVAHSPTVFQATQQACDMLDAAGFTRLSEHEALEILPGGRYYVTRNRSALVAFAVPENGFTHCQIVASHGDSPTFKLKAHAEGEAAGAYIRLDVEPYGVDHKFTDINDYWAATYVDFLYNANITTGYADGTFRPSAQLTGFAFLKMLLTALGYDSAIEGYTGPNWRLEPSGYSL